MRQPRHDVQEAAHHRGCAAARRWPARRRSCAARGAADACACRSFPEGGWRDRTPASCGRAATSCDEDAEVEQHQHDGRELEELLELDVDLQDRQRDRRLEQQRLVRDAGDGDHQVGHDGEEDQPAGMGGVARAVDGFEQTIGVDRRLPLRRVTRHILLHSDDPRLELNVTAPSKTEKVGHSGAWAAISAFRLSPCMTGRQTDIKQGARSLT